VVVTIMKMRGEERVLINAGPYKRRAKQEDETLITGTTYLPRALPNGLQGQELGY
jgi:hypothetical protein